MLKNQLNKEGFREGYWEVYYDNGELLCKGNYKNNRADGLWEYYYIGQIYLKIYYLE